MRRTLVSLWMLLRATDSFHPLCYRHCRCVPTATATSLRSEPQRSVGDVVQGLHGGKYQFDAPGISATSQQFVDQLYGGDVEEETVDYWSDPPKWIESRLQASETSTIATLSFSDDARSQSIQVQNEERTWEVYYARVTGPIVVTPSAGQLAPRGGSGGKSDAVTLQIHATGDGEGTLVVATEEDKWVYALLSQ